jgi:hypothetical protein
MTAAAQNAVDPREGLLVELLAATEALFAAISAGDDPESWGGHLDRREAAFAALVRASDEGDLGERPLAAGARECLDRIASLDATLLESGREGLARMQRERVDLGRRRQAVAAHGAQEKTLARAFAVKA